MSINALIPNRPEIAGRTIYGVVYDASHALLGRTPDYLIDSADLGTVVQLSDPAGPIAVVNPGDFFAGFAQTYQDERPANPSAYYSSLASGGNGAYVVNRGRFVMDAVTGPVTATTGTQEELTNNELLVWPNPGTGVFQMQLPEGIEKADVQVWNARGELMYRLSGVKNSIELSGKAPGLYLLRVEANDNHYSHQLVIK